MKPSGERMYMLPVGGYAALKLEALGLAEGPEEEEGIEDLECNCTD